LVYGVEDFIKLLQLINEYAKERDAPSERLGLWGVCNLSAHFAGIYCTYEGRQSRSHGLRPGARRRQGYPRPKGRKLCSLIRAILSLSTSKPHKHALVVLFAVVCVRTLVSLLSRVFGGMCAHFVLKRA
jgi:hypothetical protein